MLCFFLQIIIFDGFISFVRRGQLLTVLGTQYRLHQMYENKDDGTNVPSLLFKFSKEVNDQIFLLVRI